MAEMPRGSDPAARSRASRSKTPRNAASVLPLPVGDDRRTDRPAAISGMASRCAAAKESKRRRNQAESSGVRAEKSAASVSAGSDSRSIIRLGEAAAGFEGVDLL